MRATFDEVDDTKPYDVSVIVPTYNRRELLTRTLDSLTAQRAQGMRYEVLVVDNNSRDDTRDAVQAIAREDGRIRYLLEPQQGVSHARNAGIAAARAPILAFIDDDVEASATWVAAIKKAFDAHPEIDCLGGPIHARWAEPPPPWLTPMFWAAVALQSDKGAAPYIDANHATPCLMTANFACRRETLQQVGGFATAYMRDEDRELQLRLWAAGKRGMFVRDVTVVTEVPGDRLTKSHHRQFYTRVGESHARMRYLEAVDATGRLVGNTRRGAIVQGTPAFVYRYLAGQAVRFVANIVTLRWNRAFYNETRLRYYASYIQTRRRDDRRSLRTLPGEIVRLLLSLIQRPFRRHMATLLRKRQAA
jgi:glycosyltransferase involved in cell wall biosynthesis